MAFFGEVPLEELGAVVIVFVKEDDLEEVAACPVVVNMTLVEDVVCSDKWEDERG